MKTWSIANKAGTREGITRLIDAAEGVPDDWKTLLKAEVAALNPKFNFVKLDAHCHMLDESQTLHLSIVPSTVAI